MADEAESAANPAADLALRLVLPLTGRGLAQFSIGKPGARKKEKNGDDVVAPVAVPQSAVPPRPLSLSFSLPTAATQAEPQPAARPAATPRGDDPATPDATSIQPAGDRNAGPEAQPEIAVALRVASKPASPAGGRLTSAPVVRDQEVPEAPAAPAGQPSAHAATLWSASVAPAATTVAGAQPVSAPKPAAEAAPVEMAPELPKRVQPLKELAVEIRHNDQDRVELRLVERSGELHMAVRATDSDLAHAMREQLPELANRLDHDNHRVEAWRPGGTVTAAGPAAESQRGAQDSAYPDSQSQQRWSQPDREQHNHNRHNVPRWVEELEGKLTGQGESDGLSN